MAKKPKQTTVDRFKSKAQARRSAHSGEPIQDVGPSRVDMVKALAKTNVHGTVIRRLQQN